jgi:O-antigen/teichoic acid export membrane protein
MAETPPALDYSVETPASQTGRAVILVTSGRVLLQGAWFLATLLMARVLGPAAFATYTLATKAIQIVTDCFADPLDMAVMREAPLSLRTDRPAALAVIRSAFWMRAGLGGLSVAFAAGLPWAASAMIFGAPDHHRLAVATVLGILGDLLLRSVLGYFQVSERFTSFMVIDAIWQLGRAASVGVLFFLRILNASTAVELYASMPFIAFGAALLVLPSDILWPRFPSASKTVQILHYGKWLAAATTMTALYERLDIFLLAWLRGRAAVGPYAGALALAMVPDFLNSCIQTVLGPKVAPAAAAGKFRLLQRQYLSIAIPLGALAAVGALLAGGPIIRMVLSTRFSDSVGLFKILVLSTLFNLIFTPLPTALVSFIAPRKMTTVAAIGLMLVAGGGLLVIPHFGAIGAAVVILVARVIVGAMIVIWANGIADAGQKLVNQ